MNSVISFARTFFSAIRSGWRMACSIPLVAAFMLGGLTTSSAQPAASEAWPDPDWPKASPEEMGMDSTLLIQARDYALTGGGSGLVIRHGRQVLAWGDLEKRYDLKSTTKSFGATVLGVALKEGLVRIHDPLESCHPEFGAPLDSLAERAWLPQITLFHLATHTAGFDKPGGYGALLFEPGARWFYSDAGPNWLAECLTLVYKQDLREVMFERVFTPLGITPEDLTWRDNQYRPHEIEGIPRREFGSGIHADVDAMARLGYLYLRGGKWRNQVILPPEFVETAGDAQLELRDLPEHEELQFGGDSRLAGAPEHYGLLWWNNADGTLEQVPSDAFWSWGLYESLIIVIPSLDLVVARAGASWTREAGMRHYDLLKPFLEPIVAAAKIGATNESTRTGEAIRAPYPPSPVIEEAVWAPPEEILRLAEGSDNWPITWADDDDLYTAYGDGWGFEPRTPEKLSLGLAKVSGHPPDIHGSNLRAETAEQTGDGAAGMKASGMLMVEGVLYMWVRNANNSRLAWSADRGATWQWSDWTFQTSFGAPTFLQFGKNYAGARDGYVYLYSHDAGSAYEPADRMVLARAPAGRIADRTAYEFFRERLDDGAAAWTKEIAERGAVFAHPGRCYRSGISYNAALKRYLWVQPIPGEDIRFEGGFGIYDAPEPWGPWTTVYFTEKWDVGPGETMSLPPKWMSRDGTTAYLLSSGDDTFMVRRVSFELREETLR